MAEIDCGMVDRDNLSADIMEIFRVAPHKSQKRCTFPASFFNRHLVSHQPESAHPNSFLSCLLLLSHERAEPQHIRFVSSPFLSLLLPSDLPQDPFADAADPLANDEAGRQSYIHIRIQQRNGRKTLTTLQGLPKGGS